MPPGTAPPPLEFLRRLLFAILGFGLAGTLAELWLIGHHEDVWQWVPLALGGLALTVVAGITLAPGRTTLAACRAVMLLMLASGFVGVVQHVRGNAAFERELSPGIAGWELVRESLTGATPALAPGTMTLLGLLGLAATYRFRPPEAGDPP